MHEPAVGPSTDRAAADAAADDVVDDHAPTRPDRGRPDPVILRELAELRRTTRLEFVSDDLPQPRWRVLARTIPWPAIGALVLAVIVIAPILASGINGLMRTWHPAGDWAMIELRTFDVGTSRTPLVGPYSRYDWNHPGPWLFYLLAVPYRLTGSNPSSLLLGASLINVGAVGAMLTLAWRRARLWLLSPLAFSLALLLRGLGPALLRNPWNAWIVVIPFGLLVIATWSALEGDRWGWPIVAGTGAFLVQSHIGQLPFVAAATITAIVAVSWRRRSLRALGPGFIVLAIGWSPVLLGFARGNDNLFQIVDHFRSGGDIAGWSTGTGIAALELGAPAPWLGGPEEVMPTGGGLRLGTASLLVPVGLFVVTMVVAWFLRARAAARLQLVVLVTGIIGVVAVSHITDNVFDYLVRWWWTIAALGSAAWLYAALGIGHRLLAMARARTRAADRVVRPLRLASQVLMVVLALVFVVRATTTTIDAVSASPLPADDWTPPMDAILGATASLPTGRAVLLRADGPLVGWSFDALAPRLVAAGVDLHVVDEGLNRQKFGVRRVAPADQPDFLGLWVVTGYRIHDFRASGTGRELASFDPFSPAERIEYDRLDRLLRATYWADDRTDLVAALDDGSSLYSNRPVPGLDRLSIDRYEELRRRGVAIAVFVTERADTPVPAQRLP